jgi:hypothetical protein
MSTVGSAGGGVVLVTATPPKGKEFPDDGRD